MEFEKPREYTNEKPPRLPTAIEFRLRLLRLKKFGKEETPPPVPEQPMASDVARYGRIDWSHIKHGHGEKSQVGLARYLHRMAKLMMTREGYNGKTPTGETTTNDSLHVPDTDEEKHNWIGLTNEWTIAVQGNHRALALKILGPDFVEKSGMNDWVKIWKLSSR